MATEMLTPCLRALKQFGPKVEALAIERGLAILEGSGLKLGSFRDLAMRIPHRTGLSLLENAVETSGDAAFALHAGVSTTRGEFGLYDFLCRTAPTLGESMRVSATYLPLLHDGATIEVIEKGSVAIWRHRLRDDLPRSSGANDYVVSAFIAAAQQLIGIDFPPSEIQFAHPAPPYSEMYRQIFKTEISFDCDANTVVVPRAALQLSVKSPDPELHAMLRRYAEEQLKRLPRFSPFSARVRALVREGLGNGASFARIARALHVSESTLGRRLSAEGASYSDIVDGVRREQAMELLTHTDLNISEVAFRLGFAHRPAFHRAFKRWYGVGPKTHRERNVQSAFYRFYRRDTR